MNQSWAHEERLVERRTVIENIISNPSLCLHSTSCSSSYLPRHISIYYAGLRNPIQSFSSDAGYARATWDSRQITHADLNYSAIHIHQERCKCSVTSDFRWEPLRKKDYTVSIMMQVKHSEQQFCLKPCHSHLTHFFKLAPAIQRHKMQGCEDMHQKIGLLECPQTHMFQKFCLTFR